MAFDFEQMLRTIEERQWALADFDWDSPGAEAITEEQWPRLRAFMIDVVWIENVGARGFAALAHQAPNPTLARIYQYFHAEEQRHANAELALMRRWGMLDGDGIPEPNAQIRLAIGWLDRYADDQPLSYLGTLIPMLEVALDGALVKFLLDEVRDPLCHEVFHKINADESRHLAVDFQVLDLLGAAPLRRLLVEAVGTALRPGILIGALNFVPLMSRMRDDIVALGIDEERLYHAMRRFSAVGARSPNTRRMPGFQLFERHGRMVIDRTHPYHRFADGMVRLTDALPRRWLPKTSSWAKELTYEPVAS